ncbi:MAG: MTAP family purine nucleoside phosphorylase [Nitrospinaceae bacterium]
MTTPLAVLGGSSAYHLLTRNLLGEERERLTVDTPFGPSAPLHRFGAEGSGFWFLSRHGEEDYSVTAPFVNYRANIYALKDCGVERIIAWSGPGIINSRFRPGEFVVPHDILDETRRRESTFFKGKGWGFIRQKDPFCPAIRETLHAALHAAGAPHHETGVYVCTEGPRLESPAEIRKFRLWGADLVGMTLAPEAFLARELEMCYAPLCYLTNFAEGVAGRAFEAGQLFEGMQSAAEKVTVDAAVEKFPELLAASLARLANQKRQCACPQAMQRYRDKGMIGADWKTWLGPP